MPVIALPGAIQMPGDGRCTSSRHSWYATAPGLSTTGPPGLFGHTPYWPMSRIVRTSFCNAATPLGSPGRCPTYTHGCPFGPGWSCGSKIIGGGGTYGPD